MKKFLIGIVIFVLLEGWVVSHAAVSFQQAKQVWAKLANKSGYHVNLCYDDDTDSNAYCTGTSVCINQGMLNDLNTNDQLAMVLGHELGHFVKQHFRHEESEHDELEADAVGYKYCKQLGYKHCLTFLKRMKQLYGEEGTDGIHPTWTKRMKHLIGE